MTDAPPAFQEASRCDVCKSSFNAFRRRHHCRCCGRTLCSEHSSKQMVLPHFGIYSNVRVCDDCFNNPSWVGNNGHSSSDEVTTVVDGISKLDVDSGDAPKTKSTSRDPVAGILDCKCGMPLCICEQTPEPVPSKNSNVSNSQSNTRPKKPLSNQPTAETVSRKPSSSSSSNSSSFLKVGQASNGSIDKPKADYDVSGEGLREAIKNSDTAAVRKLLREGVDANYCDKQGMTLLHLAAVFNQTDIVFILMGHGASVERKNAQGETALDCAPAMLQYRMRQYMSGFEGGG
ncbi:1-phosphatidylinositol-3-phosphate 5-kinase [Apostasia shenzhenica]|uniref:1-phosphatidylinositol-3-phosphate 5-kinase n=1 Tax=Apostasia shenzhenica TaxID=1088818 RepID=A0A2I0A9U0_9ASPA|nr:1-phosphatidylinositol-3-phosphate 5-kinase [Apostasia shenzhenica]